MKKVLRTSNEEFFRICDALRNHREVVVKECHNKLQVATWIKQKLGLDVAANTVETALKAVGIALERQKHENKTQSRNNTRTLATELLRLYKKLGEEPSQLLVDLVERMNRGIQKPEAAPIPMSSYVDPKTIPVVNKK